jgi:transcriptional regulator with XRE-family HTH domain
MGESIGNKLKTLRKGRGLSQLDLSIRLDLSRATISNYETNRRSPSLPELKRLSNFFGVSMDYWGVETADESFELLSRARSVLLNNEIPREEREQIYREIMKMYLEME